MLFMEDLEYWMKCGQKEKSFKTDLSLLRGCAKNVSL